MPYKKNSNLPENIRRTLPTAAQTIFREAFNSAYAKYGDEIISFKVAWTAVKKKYRKENGKWVKIV